MHYQVVLTLYKKYGDKDVSRGHACTCVQVVRKQIFNGKGERELWLMVWG